MKDYTKGRGKFTAPIILDYIHIPNEIYKILYKDCFNISIKTKITALWNFIHHYFTNKDYEFLQSEDPIAYLLCRVMDSMTYHYQNNIRWKCYDERKRSGGNA